MNTCPHNEVAADATWTWCETCGATLCYADQASPYLAIAQASKVIGTATKERVDEVLTRLYDTATDAGDDLVAEWIADLGTGFQAGDVRTDELPGNLRTIASQAIAGESNP